MPSSQTLKRGYGTVATGVLFGSGSNAFGVLRGTEKGGLDGYLLYFLCTTCLSI